MIRIPDDFSMLLLGCLLPAAVLFPIDRADAGTVFEVTPAGKENILYAFKGASDGSDPEAGLLADNRGNFYGTTVIGGTGSDGTVFKLGANYNTVIYAFSKYTGVFPYAGLIMDRKGNLFGTTEGGGWTFRCPSGCGTVFKLTPHGKEIVLHSFCARKNCADGILPVAGLLVDKAGNFYGTPSRGGRDCTEQFPYGCGTVFKLTPSGEETVLYAFKGGSDGQNPAAGLIADNKGNLYGTTEEGGPRDAGTVFKISPDGSETLLHSFCSQRDCEDGAVPVAGLIADKSGNLYGTTEDGGAFCRGFLGCGTVFRISPDGTETVVHSFPGGFLGEYPCGSLTADGKGNFYGTTSYGGAYDYGTVFVMGQ